MADTPITFDLYQKTPTWHLTGDFTKDQADGFHHSRMTTRCGQVVHEMVWVQTWEGESYHQAILSETQRGTYLRRDHAELIGRMCKRCARHDDGSQDPRP